MHIHGHMICINLSLQSFFLVATSPHTKKKSQLYFAKFLLLFYKTKTAVEMQRGQTAVRATQWRKPDDHRGSFQRARLRLVQLMLHVCPYIIMTAELTLQIKKKSSIQIVTAAVACQKVVVPHAARRPAAVLTACGCHALLLSRLASDFPPGPRRSSRPTAFARNPNN